MKYHSLDYKLSAIKYYSLVSRIFGCNRTSLIRWVKLFENNKIRKSYKVKEKHVNYIKKIISPSYMSLRSNNKVEYLIFKD